MTKGTYKDAFTLIEVMIAVMIISVVIMALIQMYANNTHLFLSFKQQTKLNQYSSFLIGNEKYAYENKKLTMYNLVDDFDLQDELRQDLKDIKIELSYSEVDRIDLSEATVADEEESSSGLVMEIGSNLMQTRESSVSLLRVRQQ